MDGKEAKEIIKAGFAWSNWTEEQREAFKLAYNAIDKAERYERALKKISESNEDTPFARHIVLHARRTIAE
jgi:hypothetical protein